MGGGKEGGGGQEGEGGKKRDIFPTNHALSIIKILRQFSEFGNKIQNVI